MKKIVVLLLVICGIHHDAFSQLSAYKNKNLSPEARAKDLVFRMTLDEKLMQLQCIWGQKSAIMTNGDFDETKAEKVLKDGLGEIARINDDKGPGNPGLPPKVAAVLYNKVVNGGGSIINMSSTAGFIATRAHPAYTASKGGSRLLTKAAASEYAKSKLRVNSIHPGFTHTELTAPYLQSEQGRKDMQAQNPMGRAGEAIEIARATLFLASDDSTFMTGTELVVDGGQTSV